MTDYPWPKQNGTPTMPRDPYNLGRWPENDGCKLLTAGKRPIPRPKPKGRKP